MARKLTEETRPYQKSDSDVGMMKHAKTVSDLTELESGHVFRMTSVHDVFRKLNREMKRLENASNGGERADQVDAAINFAITAWHLTDWVWCRQEHELREAFKVNGLGEFQEIIRRECPALAVCDVIANAAKHGGVAHKRKDRPEIETILSAEPATEGAAGVELTAEPARRRWWVAHHRWSLKIEVDGDSQDLLALSTSVFGFWHKFIQRHCVAKQPS